MAISAGNLRVAHGIDRHPQPHRIVCTARALLLRDTERRGLKPRMILASPYLLASGKNGQGVTED
jgi:hypothetical protein